MERLDHRRGRARKPAASAGVLAAAALAAGSVGSSASAQPLVCMEHKSLVSYLAEKFEEQPRALGLVASRSVMEIYVSPGKGTWTIIMTSARGVGCIIAAGDTWEDVRLTAVEAPEF